MADAPAPAFGPAHRVVTDALIFATGNVLMDDPRWPVVMGCLADALPQAAPIGLPAIDRLIGAARQLHRAWTDRPTKSPGSGQAWAWAMLDVHSAVANFAWSRLAQSHAQLAPNPNPTLSPEDAA